VCWWGVPSRVGGVWGWLLRGWGCGGGGVCMRGGGDRRSIDEDPTVRVEPVELGLM